MTEPDAIVVCTLDPADEKISEACPACGIGKGPGHNKRRPITHDIFGVPADKQAGRPVFDPFNPRP